jgi:hypothetical protein
VLVEAVVVHTEMLLVVVALAVEEMVQAQVVQVVLVQLIMVAEAVLVAIPMHIAQTMVELVVQA